MSQTLAAIDTGLSSSPVKSPSAAPLNAISTLDIVEVLQRQLWLILATGSLGLLLAAIYWANAEPWYETKAKMLVTAQDPRLTSDPNKSSMNDSMVRDDILASHMEIVSGRELLQVALAQGKLDQLPSIQKQLEGEVDMDAVDYVREHLLLTKGGQGTARDARTLNIAFRHTDPDDAVAILTAIVREYEGSLNAAMSKSMETATNLIRDAETKVDAEIKALQAKYVKFSQETTVNYRSSANHPSVFQNRLQQFQHQLAELEAKRVVVQTRLSGAQSSLALVMKAGNSMTRFDKLALIDAETFERLGQMVQVQAAAMQSPVQRDAPIRMGITTMQMSERIKLEAEYAALRANFGEKHDKVVALKEQLEMMDRAREVSESKLAKTDTNIVEISPEEMLTYYARNLENELRTLDEIMIKMLSYVAEAERNAQQAVQYEVADKMMLADIERKQELYSGIVEHLQTLNTASGLAGLVHQKLEAPARGKEVWPSLPLCMIAGCLAGLVTGLCLAMMNDQVDKRFRTAAEIDQLTGVPVIAQVGRIRHSRDSRRSGRLIVDPQAPEAESFRLLRTFLLKDVKAGRMKVLSATSCQTKDGKSTILANVAAKFAETGLRTVIIDGDMRAPTSHRFFNIPIQNGLSDVLQGKIACDEALKATGIENLSAITAGAACRNPAELLQSIEFDDLLDHLRKNFDLIVVDSGPVLWVSDPAIVAQKADATLLVVRSSTDTKRKVQEAVRRLHAANANLRGCVLNTFGAAKEFTQDTYYSSPYHYYFGGYGRRVKDAPEAGGSGNGNGNGNGHGSKPHKNGNGNGHSEKIRIDGGTPGNGHRSR